MAYHSLKKVKWLLKEIDSWQQLKLIDEDTAGKLRDRYAQNKNINFLIVLFSIIGSLLVGAGLILILARNWENLPLPLRIALAFLPLCVSQALAVFVVKVKYESLAWRESIAVLVSASVFAAVAVVGQVFHLPGDYSTYILTCGLLSLPMIFILDAASPLIVYYWTVLNWAALEQAPATALFLPALIALGALFVFLKRRQINARLAYMTWVTIAACFAMVIILGIILECSLLLAALCYFTLLLSIDKIPAQLHAPFKISGALGALVTVAILTYEKMWSRLYSPLNAGDSLLTGIMLTLAVFFTVKFYNRNKHKFLFLAVLIILCAARFIWAGFALTKAPYSFILTGASNFIMLFIGAGFIIYGVRKTTLLQTNSGMAVICSLIVMRFFDSDLDFFWRGVVFLLLGAVFLTVNIRILRARKRPKEEAEA